MSEEEEIQESREDIMTKAWNEALDFLYIELLCPEQVARLFDAKFNLGRWT